MSNDSSKLSIRDGLIRVVSAERFQAKPEAGGNIHVVVMQKKAGTLRHYATLRSAHDKLSVGEKWLGDFVCYIVDMSVRKMSFEQDFATKDRITNIHIKANVSYQVENAERVAIGVEDALQQMRDELLTLLKREIVRLGLTQIEEKNLEEWLYREAARFRERLGILVQNVSMEADWSEEIKAQLKKDRQQGIDEARDDRARKRRQSIEDEQRARERKLDMEDLDYIDQYIERLGLERLPVDYRLRLHAMPRKEALKEIIDRIEKERSRYMESKKQLLQERMTRELSLLETLIKEKRLEPQDGLVDFGKELLNRYRHFTVNEDLPEFPPDLLFGASARPMLDDGKKKGRQNRLEEKKDDQDDTEEE